MESKIKEQNTIIKPVIMDLGASDSEELSLVYGKKGLFSFLTFFDEISEKDKHNINYQFAMQKPIEELLSSKRKGTIPKICGQNSIFRRFEHICSNNLMKVTCYSDESSVSDNWFQI